MTPSGFIYNEDFLNEQEQKDLHNFLNAKVWDCTTLSRRTQHYGYRYKYKFSKNDSAVTADPCPQYLKDLFLKINLQYNLIKSNDLNKLQIIVNEYTPGQGISWHIDDMNKFGDFVACLSIGCDCSLDLKLNNVSYSNETKKGSLYILQDASRYQWAHSLRNNKKNETRISVTFRTIK